MNGARVATVAGIVALAGLAGYLAFRRRGTGEAWLDSFAFMDEPRNELPPLSAGLTTDVTIQPKPFDIVGVNIMAPPTEKLPLIPRTTRGLRNRNPGNIRWIAKESSRWRGMLRDDGTGYAVFDTDQNGIRAIGRQLLVYAQRYGLNTVRAIITRWAPPTENITEAYVKAVAAALRVGAGDPINVPDRLPELTLAIIKHENGLQPYDPDDVASWSRLA